MVLRLVWHVLVVIAVLLYIMNECLVVSWSAVWGLIKVDSLDFTWRLSPRRRCPRRMCPRRMTPRRMTPRRMSPRRKAETDIHETGGTDRWRRRMALGGKACTEGSSVFMAFRPRDILLCHWSWPSQSRRRMAPRRMSPRRRKATRDGCPRDGGRPPETDVPETEEDRPRRMSPRRRKAARDGCPRDGGRPPRRMSPRWMSPRRKVCVFSSIMSDLSECDWFLLLLFSAECMGPAILSVWLMIAVLCLCSLCGLVAEWFRRQTNMGPPGSEMSAVLRWCSFRSLVTEWLRRHPNLRPPDSWLQCCVYAVSVVWWPSGSSDREIGDLPFNESSVVFL